MLPRSVIEHALKTNGKCASEIGSPIHYSFFFYFVLGIGCLRIDQNSKKENAAKKFRRDPNILVLLLHG